MITEKEIEVLKLKKEGLAQIEIAKKFNLKIFEFNNFLLKMRM